MMSIDPEQNPMMCSRCEVALIFAGTREFHEGRPWGALGNLAEIFVNREKFDIYALPRCGRVEFFIYS